MEEVIVTQVENIENHEPNQSITSEAIKKVQQWMDHEIQIIATGNRMIKGVFTCFDKQQNILLNYAYEDVVLPDGQTIRKELGVVFVPMRHVISCLVLEKKIKQQQEQQEEKKEQQD
ncbi:hypothetical protein ACTFIY_000743 [Dictyostelium cf. discoideum]